jgi:hypothetical protein
LSLFLYKEVKERMQSSTLWSHNSCSHSDNVDPGTSIYKHLYLTNTPEPGPSHLFYIICSVCHSTVLWKHCSYVKPSSSGLLLVTYTAICQYYLTSQLLSFGLCFALIYCTTGSLSFYMYH